MAHIRKQIRDKAQTALISALGISNVFISRVDPYSESELPAVNINTLSNDSQTLTGDGAAEEAINLSVDITRRAVNGVADTLDADAVLVENAFKGNGLLNNVGVVEKVSTELDIEQGSQDTATLTINYVVTLFGVTDPEQVL